MVYEGPFLASEEQILKSGRGDPIESIWIVGGVGVREYVGGRNGGVRADGYPTFEIGRGLHAIAVTCRGRDLDTEATTRT